MRPASQQHLQRGFSLAMRSVAAEIAAARDQETLGCISGCGRLAHCWRRGAAKKEEGDAGPLPAPLARMAAAMSARSSSFNSRVAAGSQPSTCPGRRAPTMAPVTPGKGSVQAMATAAGVTPWRSATGPRAAARARLCDSAGSVKSGSSARQSPGSRRAARSAVNAPWFSFIAGDPSTIAHEPRTCHRCQRPFTAPASRTSRFRLAATGLAAGRSLAGRARSPATLVSKLRHRGGNGVRWLKAVAHARLGE